MSSGRAPRWHWPEYAIEACLLGMFMLSASAFGVALFHPESPAAGAITSPLIRRCIMGAAMGLTAIALIYSGSGQRSGGHMNPAVTLTFWRLGKVRSRDAMAYVLAQLIGGVSGMLIARGLFFPRLAAREVNFVATLPGSTSYAGLVLAWLGEFFIAGMLMLTVLNVSNRPRLSPFTGLCAGALVTLWIIVEGPISGMSMNPARSFGSALAAGFSGATGSTLWIYFTAPPLAMLTAALLYTHFGLVRRAYCAKLYHPHRGPCIFNCAFGEMVKAEHMRGARETVEQSGASEVPMAAAAPTGVESTATLIPVDPALLAPDWQTTLHYG